MKQYHEVTVPVPADALATGSLDAVRELFHREHDRLYGYELRTEGTELELINLRVRVTGVTDKPVAPKLASGDAEASAARKGTRRAFLPESGSFGDVAVYDGHELHAGNRFAGPALIERVDTTILVAESFEGSAADAPLLHVEFALGECGNDVVEGSELCDGTDLGGESCVTLGYETGTLSCMSDCLGFDESDEHENNSGYSS